MWDRKDIKARGKAAFMKNYGSCVLAALLMGLLFNFASGSNAANVGNSGIMTSVDEEMMTVMALIIFVAALIAIILGVFIKNVIEVGGCKFFIDNQTGRPGVGTLFSVFRSGNYMNVVVTLFFRDLYIFLWSLLFVVPGIVKSYEYRMIPYILAENPGMDRKEAFKISREMMTGQKMEYFILELSFFGWMILSVFTFNLLNIFFVAPYMQASYAEVYYYNKVKAYQEGYIR